jgi:hypothetical protein
VIAFSPCQGRAACDDSDFFVSAKVALKEHREFVNAAAFSPDGRQIVASDSSLTGLLEALQAAGTDPQTVVLERIELETGDAFVGGADQQ